MLNIPTSSWRRRAGAVWLIVAVAAAAYGDIRLRAQSPAGQADALPAEAAAQVAAILQDKASRTPRERKLESRLLTAQRIARGRPIVAGMARMAAGLPRAADNRLIVDVRADVTPELLQQIAAAGIAVVSSSARYGSLQVQASLDQLDALTAMPEVLFVQPMARARTWGSLERQRAPSAPPAPRSQPFDRQKLSETIRRALGNQAVTNVESKVSEGDTAHKAATARSTWNVDGTGVRIGVLSDGVVHLADSQNAGELGSVTVLPGQTGTGDEGTAMLEIIHDLAPGAQLFFATAFTNSVGEFADNIRALRDAGCDIIVDDVFWYVETPFQDGQTYPSFTNGGVVTQAVKDVTATGVLYFSSAGNGGNLDQDTSSAWEGDFVSLGTLSGYPTHGFTATLNYDTLEEPVNLINLYWSDPLGGSNNDYDLLVFDSSNQLLAYSQNLQDGTQDPYEEVWAGSGYPLDADFPPFPVGSKIVVVKYSGDARFLHLSTYDGALSVATAGEIHGHAAASAVNAFGVAAARVPNPLGPFNANSLTEWFSSDGPRRVFFNGDGTPLTPGNFSSSGGTVLSKPDLTAADGVSVSGAGGFPTAGCAPNCLFYGTSAAAPHAGAIAALIKSANLSLSASQVRTALLNSAIDIRCSVSQQCVGPDRDSGVGIVMADTAVQSVFGPLMAIDLPAPGATVMQPFTISGWAIDRRSATTTGVDLVQIEATPAGGSPQSLGSAAYGGTRGDIGALFGARFTNSGYSATIDGLAPGTYTLTVSARSSISSMFESRAVMVTIQIPSHPVTAIDTPQPGATTTGAFTIAGWSADLEAEGETGVDLVHVWAFPTAGGDPRFLGEAVYGQPRPDVGDLFGADFTNSGFSLSASGLASGTYVLTVYARSTVSGAFNGSSITITVPPSTPKMYVDEPSYGSTVASSFVISGWAVDLGASSGTGVDGLHIWAYPSGGGEPIFAGPAATGGSRPDIAALFNSSQFTNAGFSLTVPENRLPPDTYTLVLFLHSTVTNTWVTEASVRVTVN